MGDSTILSNPRFNRPTHEYVFTGSQFRGGNDLSFVRFSKGTNSIDICNGGIDISSSNVNINKNLHILGDTTIDGSLNIGGNFTITRDLSVSSLTSTILKVPAIFTIDPSGHGTGDITGKVIIMGDLEVKGTTTTINSSVVDISDKMIVLASNAATPSQANGAGFEISGANVKFIYDDTDKRFETSIGLGISGNLLPTNNVSQVPVSYNTFALKNSGFSDIHIGSIKNTWIEATSYDISKVVLSNYSYIKLEFKVNFISSTEADQTLGFRVERSVTDSSWTTVFTDPSLGSNMGVGIISVYNGTFIDNLAGAPLNYGNIADNVGYRLSFQRNCPSDDAIDTSFGIIGGSGVGNYIFLQELYRPFL